MINHLNHRFNLYKKTGIGIGIVRGRVALAHRYFWNPFKFSNPFKTKTVHKWPYSCLATCSRLPPEPVESIFDVPVGEVPRFWLFGGATRMSILIYSALRAAHSKRRQHGSATAPGCEGAPAEGATAPAVQTPELNGGKDKLMKRYAATTIHEAWTSDVTEVGGYSVLTIINMATRQVLGHLVKPRGSITGGDCAALLRATMIRYGRPKLFHTDSAKIFKSKEMLDLLREQNVIRSQGHQSEIPHHNQVQERFHATLKQRLRKRLKELLGLKRTPKTFAKVSLLDEQTLKDTIYEAIQDYNNTPHSFLYGMSPQNMETAIAVNGKQTEKIIFNSTEGQLATENSLIGAKIFAYRAIVVLHHVLKWRNIFIDWHKKTDVYHEEVMKELQEIKTIRQEELRTLRQDLKNITESQRGIAILLARDKAALQGQLKDLRGELSRHVIENEELAKRVEVLENNQAYLMSRENSREQKEQEKAEQRARRASRKRAPFRTEAYIKDYTAALQHATSKNRFLEARRRVALLILCLSGMGVARAYQLMVIDLKDLRHFAQTGEGELRIPAPTRGTAPERRLLLPSVARDLVVARLDDLQELIGDLPDEEPAFRESVAGGICRWDLFKQELNRILKEAGRELNKQLTTHSFRMGLLHSIVESSGADIAQHVAGHTHVGAIEVYGRRPIRMNEIKSSLKKAYQALMLPNTRGRHNKFASKSP